MLVSLLQAIKKYEPAAQAQILAAYEFAKDAHKGQKRLSGDPYIVHCEQVALKLIAQSLDSATVSAALLHDVVEDTPYDITIIRKRFGSEIASLVDGLTKLGHVRITKRWLLFGPEQEQKIPAFDRYIETLRKLFLATAKDIRVIIIKLADRLHNMETLAGLDPARRKTYAIETLELYAPIAYRLGMNQLKGTLENLAFPHAFPKQYHDLRKIAGPTYEQSAIVADHMLAEIKVLLKSNNINAQTDARSKHRYSLWKKLKRYNNDLSQIYDLVAVRIIVDDIENCYRVLDLIHQKYPPIAYRIKDYVIHPKPNGYQSIHTTVIGPNKNVVEIQIRTKAMHEQAEFGIAAHWMYKKLQENRLSNFMNRLRPPAETAWIRELAAIGKRLKDPQELSAYWNVNFFGDRIFPITPKGDIKDLPAGASVLDFAYSIHSEIGNHATGAKVNDRMVKLSHALQSGDKVEIITNRKSSPTRDWLNLVKTHHARNYIRRALRLRGLIPAVLRKK